MVNSVLDKPYVYNWPCSREEEVTLLFAIIENQFSNLTFFYSYVGNVMLLSKILFSQFLEVYLVANSLVV